MDRSLGFTDSKSAQDALAALHGTYLQFQYRPIVHAVGDGKLPLPTFLQSYHAGRLDQLLLSLASPDPDLAEYLPAWQAWVVHRASPGTAAKYLAQVRKLIPIGRPYPASEFTRKRISEFLTTLAGKITATNRYRAALSSLGKFLVEREVLAYNPVRDVRAAREAEPRTRYLSRDEAQALISAIQPVEAQAMHALMCGTGMECGTILSLLHRDVVSREHRLIRARGTKTKDRDREVEVTELWCWEIFREWLDRNRGTPNALVFRLGYYHLDIALARATKALHVDNYTSHDWRHTYAVQSRRDGRPDWQIATQLGHCDTTQVAKRYGRFKPTRDDFRSVRHTIGLTLVADSDAGGTSKMAG